MLFRSVSRGPQHEDATTCTQRVLDHLLQGQHGDIALGGQREGGARQRLDEDLDLAACILTDALIYYAFCCNTERHR